MNFVIWILLQLIDTIEHENFMRLKEKYNLMILDRLQWPESHLPNEMNGFVFHVIFIFKS